MYLVQDDNPYFRTSVIPYHLKFKIVYFLWGEGVSGRGSRCQYKICILLIVTKWVNEQGSTDMLRFASQSSQISATFQMSLIKTYNVQMFWYCVLQTLFFEGHISQEKTEDFLRFFKVMGMITLVSNARHFPRSTKKLQITALPRTKILKTSYLVRFQVVNERAVLANMIVKEEPVTFHWRLDQYEHFAIQIWGN